MNSNVTTLIVAIVGVAGTLFASVFTQASYARAQSKKREEDKLDANLEKRRGTYLDLNRTARAYRRALLTRLDEPASPRTDLEQAQREFEARQAEVQLIAHAKVLADARRLSRCLSAVFQRVIDTNPEPAA